MVRVRDGAGRPVPGAVVTVEQQRHDFLFGCNLFGFRQHSEAHETAYRGAFASVFNYATLGFYWRDYEPRYGAPRFASTDEAVSWCRGHGIACKGHPLLWDDPVGSPQWLADVGGEVERVALARVAACVARYAERIELWDVVNEPTTLTRYNTPISAWANRLGALEYCRRALTAAREASRSARLLINDSRTDARLAAIVEGLQQRSAPLDAIGIQSHMHDTPWALERVTSTCDAYARYGIPIHFTEVSVVSAGRSSRGAWLASDAEGERRQASYVADLYTTLFAHPSIQAITWWDFSDAGAWQGAPAGLLRSDMTRKPAYDRLRELITERWWTRLRVRTGADGTARIRGFLGSHQVRAVRPTGESVATEVAWRRHEPNVVDLTFNT
jgi:GH35 family endo-1,4-beta-xylanase